MTDEPAKRPEKVACDGTDAAQRVSRDGLVPDINIIMPEGWSEIDLDPASTDDLMDATFSSIDELGVDDDDMPVRRAYELQARAAFQRARQEGAIAMLQFLAKTEDEPKLLTASLVIYLTRLAEPLADMVHTLAKDKEVDFIDLGGERSAVRVSHLVHTLLPGIEEAIPMHTVRYYREIDDSPFTAVLAYTTPNVPLADDFTDLFDDMSETFSISLPGSLRSDQ